MVELNDSFDALQGTSLEGQEENEDSKPWFKTIINMIQGKQQKAKQQEEHATIYCTYENVIMQDNMRRKKPVEDNWTNKTKMHKRNNDWQ